MKRLALFLLSIVALMASCENSDKPGNTISCDPSEKIITEAGAEFTVTVTSKMPWSAMANQSWVTINPNSGQSDAYVNVIVAAGESGTANVLFSNGESTATLVIAREASNPTDSTELVIDNGALPGKFSVSSTTQVQFSQGNLQYQVSTNTLQFAAHQYDMIGDDNANISASYNGWIDLFGWGTGNNPMLSSTDDNDYQTFTDWGVNAISNGGSKANQWRTLTKDEWVYLFHGRTKAENLFGLGSVNGINGIIILPDSWTTPSGLVFYASTVKGLKWWPGDCCYYDEVTNHFSDNAYTSNEWSKMETAGAVFLPTAGYRYGTDMYLGALGDYWSATLYDEVYAYSLFFCSDRLYLQRDDQNRVYGLSVRLVR